MIGLAQHSIVEPFDAVLVRRSARMDQALERILPDPTTAPQRLHEAMRYAVLGAGKRIRPQLVYASGIACGAEEASLDAPAAAVELVHAYSLIHDDLPAMDDDSLRRGRPTVHVAFDEATAILAGDALQALAFEVLVDAHGDAARRIALIATLAAASGTAGMCGGQALDLAATGQVQSLAALEHMHATVLFHPDVARHAFQYVDWQFDGEDLILVSRTAFDDEEGGAPRGHDANFLTFFRVEKYRSTK